MMSIDAASRQVDQEAKLKFKLQKRDGIGIYLPSVQFSLFFPLRRQRLLRHVQQRANPPMSIITLWTTDCLSL
jgi:hypothetical protein